MLFSRLLRDANLSSSAFRGDADVGIVCADSRRCVPGACFVAVRGASTDGHRYIADAVRAGCAAVVCEDASGVPDGVASATVPSTREAAGLLAQAMVGWPARRLVSIGITGTNGKTTVAHLVRSVLSAAGHSPCLLGTISYDTGARNVAAVQTTPSPDELAGLMDEAVRSGRSHLVMEVSSHALDQRRTSGIEFAVAVFTNLSGDHLDYHRSMEAYRSAKQRLFAELAPTATAVINRDDPSGPAMAEATAAATLWYGLDAKADFGARIETADLSGSRFTLSAAGRELSVFTSLIGRHNVYNCVAAAAACFAVGVPLETIAPALGAVGSVPGRLQRVNVPADYQVFVDYAHTDDALANVLAALRPVVPRRIVLVFGCGGDRDRTKRPRMAQVAEAGADLIVVTSDNPRSEEPVAIIEEILAGFSPAARRVAIVEPDRRAAITAAVEAACPGDTVLIAGKGHEAYQILGRQRIRFDDVETAEEIMQGRGVQE